MAVADGRVEFHFFYMASVAAFFTEMNRIGLIDVDGHNFPNFALMRISAWHKAQGDDVQWCEDMYWDFDRVYKSKIFTFTLDYDRPFPCEVICGGTGYDIRSRLPEEIEKSTLMDYSLYPQYSFSIQFFSRGCIRQCPFCLVREKEGYIHPVEPVQLNPNGKHIEVLDNNFFANPEWKSAIDYLLAAKQKVNLHGVDIRIMNEEEKGQSVLVLWILIMNLILYVVQCGEI